MADSQNTPNIDDPNVDDVKVAIKQLSTELGKSVKELREELDKKSVDTEKVDRIQSTLDALENKNQDIFKDYKLAENRGKDMKERVDLLEVEIARTGANGNNKNYKETVEYKALNAYCKTGLQGLAEEHKAALRTDVSTAGGFLTMIESDTVITKPFQEISDMRSISRVRTIAEKSLDMQFRDSIPTAVFEGELETATTSQSKYSQKTLTPFRQTFQTRISQDLLMDARFDMESEIMSDGRIAFSKGEGAAHIAGPGDRGPEGFTVNPDVVANARISSLSETFTFDDIMNLTGDLSEGYDPVYVFNRRTLAFLRTLKGGDGHPLWQPGMNGIVMNTINGFPYLIANDMPDIASGTIPVAFGDFRNGYTITDRTGTTIIRDELTGAAEAEVKFTMRRYTTAQVTLAETIKLLKLAA